MARAPANEIATPPPARRQGPKKTDQKVPTPSPHKRKRFQRDVGTFAVTLYSISTCFGRRVPAAPFWCIFFKETSREVDKNGEANVWGQAWGHDEDPPILRFLFTALKPKSPRASVIFWGHTGRADRQRPRRLQKMLLFKTVHNIRDHISSDFSRRLGLSYTFPIYFPLA